MFRKALLPALAIAMLSGCATDYAYRNGNGNGDYYYGQPQVEYRYIGGYGSYGYGSYGYGSGYGSPGYYYDRYGRLVYGQPYGYYGTPYPGGYWPYRPRSPRGGGQHHGDDNDDHHGDNRDGRRPPWRNIGGVRPDGQEESPDGNRPRRRAAPAFQSVPQPQRVIASPSAGSSDGDGGARLGGRSGGGGERARTRSTRPSED